MLPVITTARSFLSFGLFGRGAALLEKANFSSNWSNISKGAGMRRELRCLESCGCDEQRVVMKLLIRKAQGTLVGLRWLAG